MKRSTIHNISEISVWVNKLPRKICAKKQYKPLFCFSLAIVMLVGMLASSFSTLPVQAQVERRQILFINSYHVGYKFSDDITRAILETFSADENVELRVEYLDTKRISDDTYFEEIYQIFEHKYKNVDLDLIISSDDAALNFLFEYADRLFPNVPVVFVGANYFDETRLAGHSNFTGISEEADIPGTLATALKIHPNVNHIVVVNDTTVTGVNVHRALEQLIPLYPQLTFEFLEDISMTDIQARVASLDPNSLVLLTIFSRDSEGNFFEYNQFTPLVAESSAVPVYGTWDFSLGYGIVGGKLISGYTEGKRGAELALRILDGEIPSNIPVEYQVNSQYMFDYNVMERFDIPLSSLPQDSYILNRPVSFFETNRNIILGTVIGFIFLFIIIAFLVANNLQRRRTQEKLSSTNLELQGIRASLEQEVAKRIKALETSTEVSRRLSTILDQEQLVREVVEQLRSAFGYYHAQIYLFDENKQNLMMVGGTGDAGRTMLARGHKLARGQGLVGQAAENNQVILIPDITQAEGWLPNPLLPETKAELTVPITIGDEVFGVLDVQHNITNGLGEQDSELIQAIANQVAVAVLNASAYQQAQRQAIRETQILNINQRIQTAGTIEDVLKIAVRELGQALETDRADIEVSMNHPSNGGTNAG